MAQIPEAVVTPAGANPAPRAAAASDTVIPTYDTYVHVDNASAGAVTVTVVAKRQCNRGSLHDLSVSVPAGQKRIIGPIDAYNFADPVSGLASVNYSATASVTVYAVRQ